MISIVVPVYNVERLLLRSVQSIIGQSYTDIEIILVDDGSTDESGRLCDEIARQDSRIKVIHQQNRGLSAARNVGLEVAQGDYIGFVDSDDWIAADMYETLFQVIVGNDTQIAICQLCIATDQSLYKARSKASDQQSYVTTDAVRLLISNGISTSACDKLYKRDVLGTNPFPEGRYFEDMFFMAEIFSRCAKIVVISAPLYYYYRRGGSICYTSSGKHFTDYYDASLARNRFVADLFPELKSLSEAMHILCITRLHFDILRAKHNMVCKELRSVISGEIKQYAFSDLIRLPVKRLPSILILRYFPALSGAYLFVERLYSRLFTSMGISTLKYIKSNR